MATTVARHGAPGPNAAEWAQELGQDLTEDIDELEQSSEMIDSTFNTTLLYLQARCTIDPRAAELETWEAVVNAMQLGSAMFAAAGVSQGTVECRINRELRNIPALGPSSFADAGNWLTSFWLAVVCRNQKRMTELCEIPLDRLRSPEGAYDAYIYHWVDVLQTYWLQRPGLVDKLIVAIETSHPDATSVTPLPLLQAVLYPPINLFHRFVTKDEQGFNQALVEALELHKAYWTANEDRAADPDGRIALGPLAVACLAYDGEIPIEVESEYLPKHLLHRGWLGEFPT
ncbi:immunity 49 family protein [Streptomyces sp. MST-110588]|uniref:immunity 49 family protein n=1 Tax=Streptomyces sp. MST-110588 TaxID=2833628 RepID=UPI001F5DBA33|nr:immunity 49 family protein [Streptomyces sp. MST-110588]UNO40667.1 immunity 49 family protein [Streptomyces sp. MST-110588]